MKKTHFRVAALAAVAAAAIAVPALATHSWGNYHWSRTSAQITPPVVTSITDGWQSYVDGAVADWNQSIYINSPGPTAATGVNPRTCRAQSGKILVCNAKYGQNGWLGIASIWLSGDHIVQGTTKLNDTYFNMVTYNTPDWRALVACQEIGHDYGLGHQDEDFNNADVQDVNGIETCMDYTRYPDGNEHPNKHDYDQLEIMYAHSHSPFTALSPGQSSSPGLSGATSGDTPVDWGRAVSFTRDGRPDVFVQELGGGKRKITHVFWALGEGPSRHSGH